MLRKLVNQAEVSILLWPEEPLLVASGIPSPSGVDLPFVLTYRKVDETGSSERGEPYLPGSSLKGVLRSHAEKLSRALAPAARVCDPHFHERKPAADGERVPFCGDCWRGAGNRAEPQDVYRQSCPICRTFGSTSYRGRFAIGDAYLADGETARVERRDGVGIDRFSGGASRGVKFEMEVVTRGRFRTRIRLENFEDWQFGLMALLCRDLEDRFISIGHSTTRGLGRLGASIERLEVQYVVPRSKMLRPDQIHGVGSLLGDEGIKYGYRADDRIALTNPVALEDRVIRRVQSFGDTSTRRAFFDDAVGRWAERMEGWRAAADQP